MAWSKDKGTIAKVNADYAKVQGDYAKTEANKVERFVEDNKTKWLPAVATVAARNSAYPNPEHGDTVRVTSEAKTYRYVSPTGWVVTDIYDASAIDQVAQQLAQTALKEEVRESTDLRPIDVSEMNTATKQLFTGGAVAVVGINSVGSENVKSKAVTPAKTTFIITSSNLFNKNDVTLGHSIDATTGNNVSNPLYNVSKFIEVDSDTQYRMASVGRWAQYDSGFNFISSNTVQSLRTNVNATFLKLAVHKDNMNVAQINKGDTLLQYEPFALKFSPDLNPLKTGVIKREHLSENIVGLENVDFVEYSTNLLDAKSLIPGYTISATTGEPTVNSVNNLTDFMKVEPNAYYTTANIARRAFYDENKAFISSTTGNTSFVTPTNARYARWVVGNANLEIAQVNKGDTLLPYEPYYVRLAGLTDVVKEDKVDVVNENHYVRKINSNEVYTAPLLSDVSVSSPNNLKELLHTDIYTMYDELVTNYPHYVTKTLLGTEATGRELYRYDFKPPRLDQKGVKIPKIFITSGTHGSEKTGVWVTLQTVKQMCEAWDTQEALENLRWNVHLIIIPVTNPWGWDFITAGSGNRTGTRKNSNGVDISRNFPTGWTLGSDPTASTYGGTAPLSELEAQHVNTVLEAEKDNLIYVCDFHNFFTRTGSIWNAAATNFHINLGEHLVSHMSRKWKKEHDFMPQDETTLVGVADMGSPNGSQGKHATSLGIHGGTFEVSEFCPWENEGNGVGNSPLAIKFGMDAFVNWLNLVVKNSLDFETA